MGGTPPETATGPPRVAFLGSRTLLEGCAPGGAHRFLAHQCFCAGPDLESDFERLVDDVSAFEPQVTVVLDPTALPSGANEALPGTTLGVLVEAPPEAAHTVALERFDRLVSFDPALTGTRIGSSELWRAVPPPVSDQLFADVRPLHGAPRAMSIGRSTPHREAILLPVKHHHDLLEVLHGVSGPLLGELLSERDVGIYVPRKAGPGFGHQACVHLAAGHLLLAGPLTPSHGLEREIDYLHAVSSDGLVWLLDRLGRFPEMYQRIRIRGRLKAEQFRASRLFARLVTDLLADVAAFGRAG